MEIFLAINQTTGYMEMIFDNEPDALAWSNAKTAETGDVYSIECEDACQNFAQISWCVARYNVWGRLYNKIINERETMRDTRNYYIVEMTDGVTFEMDTALGIDQTDYLVDNYYKGRIARFWVNGVEWLEPTA